VVVEEEGQRAGKVEETHLGEEKKTPEAQQPNLALLRKNQQQHPQPRVRETTKKTAIPPQLQQRTNSSEAGAKQRREKERLELKKKEHQQRQAAELRRRQDIQCTFPENFNNNTTTIIMPQTTNNGRVCATEPDDSQHDQQQQQQQRTTNQPRTSSAGFSIGANNRNNNSEHNHNINDETAPTHPRTVQPTPLFERLVTEEVQELKAYARIIENQNRRLAELERVHGDLEVRLEMESRGREDLEAMLEMREREWTLRFNELEADRDQWKQVVQLEQTKNSRLIDQVVRKDQDIHRMLKKKVRRLSVSESPHSVVALDLFFLEFRLRCKNMNTHTFIFVDHVFFFSMTMIQSPHETFGPRQRRLPNETCCSSPRVVRQE
jgi:hypothetical protein